MRFSFIKKDGFFLKVLVGIIDVFLINFSFYLAFHLRFNFQPSMTNIRPFYAIIPYISIVTLIVYIFFDMLSMSYKSIVDNLFKVFSCLLLVDIITAGILYFNRGFSFPRSIFIIGFVVQFVLLAVFKSYLLLKMKKNYRKKRILIIGSKEDTENIAKRLLLSKDNLDDLRYICNNIDHNIYKLIDEVDKIYVGPSVSSEVKSELISYCIGKNKLVYLVPELFEIAMINARTVQLDDLPVFEIDNLHLSFEKMIIKRIFDGVLSFIGIVLTLPIMAVTALIIKLYDRGPVLYIQERVTQGNRKFKLYKFRTMIVNAEKKTGPVLAYDRDPRITPLGRFLRASRLDELPQLFNVLKGDMSIVGPRPERQHFINEFTKDIPHFKYRIMVKAGVTGLAQVLGKYTTSPEDKARFDLLYIRNYSLWLDLKIMLRTFKVVFLKDKSSGVKEEKSLEEVLISLNIQAHEEISATRIDQFR